MSAKKSVKNSVRKSKEITDTDRTELGRLVAEGFTSGLLNCDGYEISWVLSANVVRV